MTKHLYRRLQNGLLLFTGLVIGATFYLQYIGGIEPCPLCLMQRFCALILFVICIVGVCQSTLVHTKGIAGLQIVFAMMGLLIAFRQLWLQHLPLGQAPGCIPDFSVLIHYFPWKDVVHALFWGAGDCAEVTWRWLGLPMPAWSAVYFLTMLVVSVVIVFRQASPVNGVKKKSK